MSKDGFWSLGLRKEALTLLPVAVLVLVAVSVFTLLSYRRAVDGFIASRRAEATKLARIVADELTAASNQPTARDLRRWAPQASRVALLDQTGVALVQVGGLPEGNLLLPLGEERPRLVVIGPTADLPGQLVAFALVGEFPARRYVRVDLPVADLMAHRRSLRWLSGLVGLVGVGMTVLILLYSRHLVAPLDQLLERAHYVERSGEPKNEVAFLVDTFDRAMEALARGEENSEADDQDDIEALERTLGPNMESGLLLLDRAGQVLAVNPLGGELLEVSPPAERSPGQRSPGQRSPAQRMAERPSPPVATFLKHHPPLVEVLSRAVENQEGVQRAEIPIRHSMGERTLGLTVHLLRRRGEVGGFLVLFADLTEVRRQAGEREMGQRIAQLGEMAAGVAHELRNAVATLTGYLGLLERHPSDEIVADYVAEMRRETEQLERVVTDFLAFARPGTARLEPVDLEALVQRVLASPVLRGAELVSAAAARQTIKGDAQLLERALFNLVRNALDAQSENRPQESVEVAVEHLSDHSVITISDRGVGLPPEVRERLFEPFVTSKPDGVGLGLSLARRIVDLHQGQLDLEDRPGGGTVARLTLRT